MVPKVIALVDLSTKYEPGKALGGSSATISKLVTPLIFNALVISGIVGFILLIFTGFNYINAGGDKNKIAQATNSINYILLGLALITASIVITVVVGNVLGIKLLPI